MKPLTYLTAGCLFIVGLGTGWVINGWRLNAKIAEIEAKNVTAALNDLVAAGGKVKAAADDAHVDVSALSTKLDQIRKDFVYAKPATLPVDCSPDSPRVRKLTDAAAAIDQAITR